MAARFSERWNRLRIHRDPKRLSRALELLKSTDGLSEVAEGLLSQVRPEQVMEGKAPYDSALLEEYYGAACQMFLDRDTENAADVFFLLCLWAEQSPNCFQCLGIAEQERGNLELALHAYQTANLLNPNQPSLKLYEAECQLLLDRPDLAQEAVDQALDWMADYHKPMDWDRAQALKCALEDR